MCKGDLKPNVTVCSIKPGMREKSMGAKLGSRGLIEVEFKICLEKLNEKRMESVLNERSCMRQEY